MNLFFLAWYNWRSFYDLHFAGLLYMFLFAAITWFIIQGIDIICKLLRSKRKEL